MHDRTSRGSYGCNIHGGGGHHERELEYEYTTDTDICYSRAMCTVNASTYTRLADMFKTRATVAVFGWIVF